MTSYLLYLEQAAEGCDDSIGCGVRVEKLQARTEAEALAEARQLILVGDDPECVSQYLLEHNRLRTAVIYEVARAVVCPLPEWYREHAEAKAAWIARQVEKKERREYERLKAKYG